MLPTCLFQIYSEKSFLVHNNWQPINLHTVVDNIQKRSNYDLKSNEFKPRMISVMLSGSKVMNDKLKNGLASFYKELDEINNKSANDIWDYLLEFPKNIHNVGSALISDFIKGDDLVKSHAADLTV